jgi:hypothetical protein
MNTNRLSFFCGVQLATTFFGMRKEKIRMNAEDQAIDQFTQDVAEDNQSMCVGVWARSLIYSQGPEKGLSEIVLLTPHYVGHARTAMSSQDD